MMPENGREFNYRYGGTYISVDRDGRRNPVRLLEASSLDRFEIATDGTLDREPRFGDFNFDYPQLGYIDIYDNAWYVSRATSREYKRGLIPHRLSFALALVGNTRRVRTPATDSWDTLRAIYNPKYVPFDEAVAMVLRGERPSVPVNKEMAIGIHHDFTAPVIFYENQLAGWVEDGVAKIAEPMDFVSYDLVVNGIESEVVDANSTE